MNSVKSISYTSISSSTIKSFIYDDTYMCYDVPLVGPFDVIKPPYYTRQTLYSGVFAITLVCIALFVSITMFIILVSLGQEDFKNQDGLYQLFFVGGITMISVLSLHLLIVIAVQWMVERRKLARLR